MASRLEIGKLLGVAGSTAPRKQPGRLSRRRIVVGRMTIRAEGRSLRYVAMGEVNVLMAVRADGGALPGGNGRILRKIPVPVLAVTRETGNCWAVYRNAESIHLMAVGAVPVLGPGILSDGVGRDAHHKSEQGKGDHSRRPCPSGLHGTDPTGGSTGASPHADRMLWVGEVALNALGHHPPLSAPPSRSRRPENALDLLSHHPRQRPEPDHRQEHDEGEAQERCRDQKPDGLGRGPFP